MDYTKRKIAQFQFKYQHVISNYSLHKWQSVITDQ